MDEISFLNRKIRVVAGTGLLEGIPDLLRNEICDQATVIQLKKGESLFISGQPWPYLGIVISGLLQVIEFNSIGKAYSVLPVRQGNVLGILSIIDGGVQTETARTATSVELLLLSQKNALALIGHSPNALRRLLARLAESIRQLKRQRMIMTIPSAYERIYGLLNEFFTLRNGAYFIEALPSQAVFSEMANTSRETVSRALQELIKDGVLVKTVGGFEVRSPEFFKKKIALQGSKGN